MKTWSTFLLLILLAAGVCQAQDFPTMLPNVSISPNAQSKSKGILAGVVDISKVTSISIGQSFMSGTQLIDKSNFHTFKFTIPGVADKYLYTITTNDELLELIKIAYFLELENKLASFEASGDAGLKAYIAMYNITPDKVGETTNNTIKVAKKAAHQSAVKYFLQLRSHDRMRYFPTMPYG